MFRALTHFRLCHISDCNTHSTAGFQTYHRPSETAFRDRFVSLQIRSLCFGCSRSSSHVLFGFYSERKCIHVTRTYLLITAQTVLVSFGHLLDTALCDNVCRCWTLLCYLCSRPSSVWPRRLLPAAKEERKSMDQCGFRFKRSQCSAIVQR